MSILRKRYRARAGRSPLGDTVNAVITAIGTGVDVARDPYLQEFACRLEQLHAINSGVAPGQCATTAPGLSGGVGLRKLMPPLRAYVYAEQRPWVYVAAAAAVIGLPMAIGYAIGKGS